VKCPPRYQRGNALPGLRMFSGSHAALMRECKSIAEKTNYHVILAAHGEMPQTEGICHYSLGVVPRRRLFRLAKSQFVSIWCLTRFKVDVWHIHDPELLMFALLLLLLKKKVIFITCLKNLSSLVWAGLLTLKV
jgi:hypothetical protein